MSQHGELSAITPPPFSERFPLGEHVKRDAPPTNQKNLRNPNHHCFSKKYRNAPPICIAIRLQFVSQYFWCPIRSEEREILSVLLPFVSQYASHLYCNTPPICIAIFLGKSWWLWSPECSPTKGHLSDTCAIPHENQANGCDTPLCDYHTILKRYCAIWGGYPALGR